MASGGVFGILDSAKSRLKGEDGTMEEMHSHRWWILHLLKATMDRATDTALVSKAKASFSIIYCDFSCKAW